MSCQNESSVETSQEMEALEGNGRMPDLFDIVKSWIPRRSSAEMDPTNPNSNPNPNTNPSNLPRDFWMPDQSCRVCYDCDSQFNLLNRRHHCRVCGRVFCSRCTVFVPRQPHSDQAEGERIRVCNFCLKQRKEVLTGAAGRNANGADYLVLSPTLSSASLESSKSSSCTGQTFSSLTGGSGSGSNGNYQNNNDFAAGDYVRFDRVVATDPCPEMEEFLKPGKVKEDAEKACEQYVYRSDDDDEDYGGSRSDSETLRDQNSDDYYALVDFHNAHAPYQSDQVQVYSSADQKPPPSPVHAESSTFTSSFNSDQTGESRGYSGDECPTTSSVLYGMEHLEENMVDIENNPLLWILPDPEDGEDEGEPSLEEEDDAASAGEEWRYLRTNSFGGLFPSRERSAEEHKKVMKSVVDGHFRALICQLLNVENVPTGEGEGRDGWLDIITRLAWDAASLLKPDMSKGEGMDPGGYVKVKCIACGHPSDSVVVRGVVCKKNAAHRRMATKIVKPRILILEGALEYQRVSNLLSSFDTLLQQEMEYLKMAVAKIQVHQPDVLLVEKAVSRGAQELFLNRNISLVLNVKRPLLERIARCTGAQIVPSIDHLSNAKLGQCELFHVGKFLEEHGSVGEEGKKLVKTLMFFEDCPRPFGCTILLKGAGGNELKKVKHVVQYAVFAAYHLALETSFLADEGATLPQLPLPTPLLVGLPEKPSVVERSIALVKPNPLQQSQNEGGAIFSPLLSESRSSSSLFGFLSESFLPSQIQSSTVKENQNGIVEKQLDSLAVDVSRSTKDENMLKKDDYLLSPSDHQSILVSLSSRCDWKKTACEGAHLLRIKYYGSCDRPLGRFLREQLFDQSYQCHFCEMPPEAHVYCYTHRQGSLTISVRKLPDFHLPGESEGKIWMWHRCLKCPQVNKLPPANKRVVMSDAAWRLSFGKFLELSFSNNAAASRVASCGHSLHRDCLRFYGFGSMIACFRYASTKVHNVYLPPPKLDFGFLHQEWVGKEAAEVARSVDHVFAEISNALQRIADRWPITGSLDGNEKLLESRRNIADLEMILQSEKAEFEEMVVKLTKKETEKGEPIIDILEVNRLKRQLLFLSYLWDQRLILATGSTKDKVEPFSNSSSRSAPHSKSDEQPSDDLEQVSVDGNKPKGNYGNSASLHEQSGSGLLEPGPVVRRVLSDSQFPLTADISDTLDAKWRGEGGKYLFELASLANKLPGLTDDKAKGLVRTPFSVFYDSLNKNPSGVARLDALGEYNPCYVTSFRDLARRQSGARMFLPLGVNATVIPVFDDEPTSIISYALVSRDYHLQLSDEAVKHKEVVGMDASVQMPMYDFQLMHDDLSSDSYKIVSSADDPIGSTKANHIKVSFEGSGPLGKAKFTVLCYYAKSFEALRKKCCPSEVDFVRSLSRCKNWGAQGGKSNAFFKKSLDDRFIIKQVNKTELESFIKFAPEYFKYLSESISTGSPTCLAKILGIYQVTMKHSKGGKESKMDLLVMENLLFGRNITRLYDLKGSRRSRYNSDSSGNNKVLLDQNLIEMMPTSPIFVGNKAKRILERAIWNDTSFLASIDVMDYSLLVGVDKERHELVLGIIDFMRQYTWDKHLETWAKSSGILGGPKNASPTVVSPKEYKKRFRKAMSAYFIVVPDQWPAAVGAPNKSCSDLTQVEAQSISQVWEEACP